MPTEILEFPGFHIGQAEDRQALTGCTVILCEENTTAGVDQRGGAPGTRETDALRPMHLVPNVHALLLAGGSAYGLDAAGGVMQYLEEKGIGFETEAARVPIVPAAVLYDLAIGSADVRPDAAMGYQACVNAHTKPFREGNYGAGTGASVGKMLGMGNAVKTGIGGAKIDLGGGLYVGALIAVNAAGDIYDPHTGRMLAGARTENGFLSSMEIMKSMLGTDAAALSSGSNTVIGVVMTNATLSREAANKVAQMAQNGLARTIRPAHSMFDGDTIFALASCRHQAGKSPMDISMIGEAAAATVAAAILRGVRKAVKAGGLPSISDL